MLGIVLVNYKNSKEILHYIKNELSKIQIDNAIIVVDNSVDKFEYDQLNNSIKGLSHNSYCQDISIIDAKENLGFAKGNNLGAKYLIEKYNVENILFSNSDIIIKDQDIIAKLIASFHKNNKIAQVGPKVIKNTGQLQSPCRYLPFSNRYIWGKLFYLLARYFQKYIPIFDVIENAGSGCYYRLIGCFFIFKTKVFIEAGMFDENTFLYGEEKIMAERLQMLGYYTYYNCDVSVIHNESSTTRSFYSEKEKWGKIFLSDLYYYKNYIGVNGTYLNLGKFALWFHLNFNLRILSLINRFK